jgi:4-aminobutyrate aminotransferase-like enzyme
VHVAPLPDCYRGEFRGDADAAATRYSDCVASVIEEMRRDGRELCAFLAETCPSVGGQIIPPRGYFQQVYRHVRAAGGVCIADEVQTGFGRMGDNFWAFEGHGVVPDILVLGKPMGNGYPLGAVVTTRAIADAFDNGMEFFSTFGGSTVSCAAGLAVLDVLRDEGLQAHASRVGALFGALLHRLRDRHELVGDVRGSGLFWGVELVKDRQSLSPASREAARVAEAMKNVGVLIGTDGPYHNVLKIRPPMQFDENNAAYLCEALNEVIANP